MTRQRPKVLIAGGGWRVSRFIVPALLNEGISRTDITIFRRSSPSPADPMLQSLQTVTNLADLSDAQFEMTLNCVSAQSLVPVQQHLVQRYRRAVHFCDTPSFSERDNLLQVVKLSRANIYSLEDWPLMPNLAFLASEARRARGSTVDLRLEYFGILVHFLSLYRTLHGGVSPFGRQLAKRDAEYIGQPVSRTRVTFVANKQLPLAKTSLRTNSAHIEDFFEVETEPHADKEVLYRVIDRGVVRYHRGAEELGVYKVDESLLRGFCPFDERKNVHELDKFIGLAQMFRSVLNGSKPTAYPYLSSARDSLTVRRLGVRTSSFLM
jgi:hypothetical protein